MNQGKYEDLGLIDYKEAWDYQEIQFNTIVDTKLHNRENPTDPQPIINKLLFCEHPHVYTLGKSGEVNNLLINEQFLARINATFYKINRGGDITYHGPGQLVGYPIFDLEQMNQSVKSYIDTLEEAIILTIAEYGIAGSRLPGATGVWLDVDVPGKARKICAIGVRASRYVSMHGFALNANTDLQYFSYINPCGFIDKGVTSIKQEIGEEVDMTDLKQKLKLNIQKVFDLQLY